MSRRPLVQQVPATVLVLIFVLTQTGTSQATFSGPSTVNPGQTFTYQINVGSGPALYGVDMCNTGTSPGLFLPETGRTIPLNPPYWMSQFHYDWVYPTVFQNFVGLTNGVGAATAQVSVPNYPFLVGGVMYAAMITADPSSPDHVGVIGGPVQTSIVSPTPTTTSISQFGITWTFSQAVPAGQFANGDWWVVGPVSIVSINPPSTNVGGRIVNGSMVNPLGGVIDEGYDSQLYQQYQGTLYVPSLNRAYGVSSASPLVLLPGSSLVSTISLNPPVPHVSLSSAAVLTVLDAAAPLGSFRPPYAGPNKAIQFNKSQIDYTKLGNLAPVAGTPSLSSVEALFERPWIDSIPDWIGGYQHPAQNMPDYGREYVDQFGIGTLLANMNFTNAQKETLLVRQIQIGIDNWGIMQCGGANNWRANGGCNSGRKWSILFAGIVLNNAAMQNPGNLFQEDDQTFVIAYTSPGVINQGFGGYTTADVGLSEWGVRHTGAPGSGPQYDDVNWVDYRVCCTAHAWIGEALSARIMGAMALWNHSVFFDYQDRYMQVMATNGTPAWERAFTPWCGTMWDTYRSQY